MKKREWGIDVTWKGWIIDGVKYVKEDEVIEIISKAIAQEREQVCQEIGEWANEHSYRLGPDDNLRFPVNFVMLGELLAKLKQEEK